MYGTGRRSMADDEDFYWRVGTALGILPALIVLVGSWWYCAATYGFLFGFGLGWLPSLIAGGMTFFAVRLLWGPTALLIVLLAIFLVYDLYLFDRSGGANQSVASEGKASPTSWEPLLRKNQSAWIGHYTGDFGGGATGSVDLAPFSKNGENIHIALQSKSCVGRISGSTDFSANPISFGTYDPSHGVLCYVKISKFDGYLEIKEENCSGMHGATCSFDGRVRLGNNRIGH